jgi:hypothetical protein
MKNLTRIVVAGLLAFVPAVLPTALVGGAAQAEEPYNLAPVLGTKGALFPSLAGLKRDMSPEDAGKVVPGAEKFDKYGFAEVKVTTIPGVDHYRFYFAKNDAGVPAELFSVEYHLTMSLAGDDKFQGLADQLVAQLGPQKPENLEKKLLTWAGIPGWGVIQFYKMPSQSWHLKVTLQTPR